MNTFASVRRSVARVSWLLGAGATMLLASTYAAEMLGATLAPLFFGFGLCIVGLAVGDVMLRIMQPRVDAQRCADRAVESSTGAGLVYLGRCILAGVVLMLMVSASRAQPPTAAVPLLPVLKAEQVRYWPTMPLPSALGAQVEQETCRSLTHRMCWSPRAELKTSREQGVGLGQLTRAFRANGSTRFDAMAEIVASFPRELNGLSWERRYDPVLQLRALVLKDLQGYRLVLDTDTDMDRLAMAFAAYNGGLGGLGSDRRACAGTPGCDSGRWFGHVEKTSLKAKMSVKGYGKSFFEINREYVTNVMHVRRLRYLSLEPNQETQCSKLPSASA